MKSALTLAFRRSLPRLAKIRLGLSPRSPSSCSLSNTDASRAAQELRTTPTPSTRNVTAPADSRTAVISEWHVYGGAEGRCG